MHGSILKNAPTPPVSRLRAKVGEAVDGKKVWAVERRMTRAELEEAEARMEPCYKWPFQLDDFQVCISGANADTIMVTDTHTTLHYTTRLSPRCAVPTVTARGDCAHGPGRLRVRCSAHVRW